MFARGSKSRSLYLADSITLGVECFTKRVSMQVGEGY